MNRITISPKSISDNANSKLFNFSDFKIEDFRDEIPQYQPFLARIHSTFVNEITQGKLIERYINKIKTYLAECVSGSWDVAESYDSVVWWFKSVASVFYSSLYKLSEEELEFEEAKERYYRERTSHDGVINCIKGFRKDYLFLKTYNPESKCFEDVDEDYSYDYFIALHDFLHNQHDICESYTFENMFEDCLKACVLRRLAFLAARDSKVTKDNFVVKTLPLSDEDTNLLIFDICESLINELDRLVRIIIERDSIEKAIGRKLKTRENKIKVLLEENKRLRKENEAQKKALNAVSEHFLNDEEEIDDDSAVEKAAYEELLNRNFELSRKEAKTKRLYNSLLEKHKNLLDAVGEPDPEEKPLKETEIKSLNMNGRYIFVADERRSTFVSNITKMFPNSDVTQGAMDFSAETIDMVVFMTEMIHHSAYEKIKNICKAKNIPNIHCPFKKPDMIKSLMEQYVDCK